MENTETKSAETVTPVQTAEVDVHALQEQLDAIKRAQAGSDKAYQDAAKKASALEAENEKLKKEKMSEKEKADYELKQKEQQLEIKSREVAEASLRFSKMQILSAKAIPLEFAEYIGGNTEDEISTNADTFTKRFNEAVGKGVEAKLVGNKAPQSGTTTQSINYEGMSFKQLDALARDGKL